MPLSAGVDEMGTAGRKILGHGYVVREICKTCHPRRVCEHSRKYDKLKILLSWHIRLEGP
jgi:hypothetical protein